jgi:hypothetical protein
MLRYNINTGVRKIKTKTAIIASTVVLGLGGATFGLALPFAAHAAGNSTPGIDRYLSNQGMQQAIDVGAQCGTGAGSGAFGFLGKGNNPGDPSWDGGNGTAPGTTAQTGINNSAVCGNRQGNL